MHFKRLEILYIADMNIGCGCAHGKSPVIASWPWAVCTCPGRCPPAPGHSHTPPRCRSGSVYTGHTHTWRSNPGAPCQQRG